jgi:ABC-type glycerol-3-phosphate transport system substrate-binding protein
MKKMVSKIIAIAVFASLMGQGCTKGSSPEAVKLSEKKTLVVWGVIDDYENYSKVFTDFKKSYPYVTIDFKKFRLEEYEGKLLNAMAEDRGPDVFMVHNTWVGKYLPKLQPEPLTVKVADQIVTGGAQKKVSLQVSDKKLLSPSALRNEFADAVAFDAIRNVNVSTDPKKADLQDRVIGIPMSLDTLALYYNKDLMNAAGVAVPPAGWDDFQKAVKKLTVLDNKGAIVQAGAGFGTGANVERSGDIMALLMMQNRTEMAGSDGYPKFQAMPQALSGELDEPPAVSALRFYTDFANPAKDVYTWNLSMPNSLDAFANGTAAFYVGYSYSRPTIASRAPKMNMGVSEVPQINPGMKANVANYWLWSVSKRSKSADLAWYFVNFMTGKDHVSDYLKVAKRPAARKSLIESQLEDPDVGVFASQVLTAKSWYRGVDPAGMEAAFEGMIDSVVKGEVEPDRLYDAVRLAAERVSVTMRSQ